MKNVLVTGAFGGMGRATVQLLKAQGVRVFALDQRVGETEGSVIPIAADLTSEEALCAALGEVRAYTEHLDAILHFAGIYMLDSLVEMEPSSFDRIFDVNLRGVFMVNRIFLPLLGEGSRILIITSELAALDPLPFTGVYAVSKAALDKYAYALAMELQLLGIRVSVLRAGAVETDMLGASTAALDRFCEGTKLYSCNAARFKRIVGRVEARCIPPRKIAERSVRILKKKRPRFAYAINRNPLLCLLNVLPKRVQLGAIRRVLK